MTAVVCVLTRQVVLWAPLPVISERPIGQRPLVEHIDSLHRASVFSATKNSLSSSPTTRSGPISSKHAHSHKALPPRFLCNKVFSSLLSAIHYQVSLEIHRNKSNDKFGDLENHKKTI